jgi:hypothetical protein
VGGYGSGIYFSHSLGEVASCTMTDNRAWLGGGLLVSTASEVRVQNSLIAFNTQGAGLALFNGEVEISRCDIFGNIGGDWIDGIADQVGIDCNFSEDPLFCDAADQDYSLQEDSPCLPENNEGCGLIGALPLDCESVTAAPLGGGLAVPVRISSFPNPFNPETSIRFFLPEAADVDLSVYTSGGRRVTALLEGILQSGNHEFTWEPRDDFEHPLSSGIYLLRLEAGAIIITHRVLLLK